jgi:hypothetical protein
MKKQVKKQVELFEQVAAITIAARKSVVRNTNPQWSQLII